LNTTHVDANISLLQTGIDFPLKTLRKTNHINVPFDNVSVRLGLHAWPDRAQRVMKISVAGDSNAIQHVPFLSLVTISCRFDFSARWQEFERLRRREKEMFPD
jgi:hypothetical protein